MRTPLENLLFSLSLDQSWLESQDGDHGEWSGLMVGPITADMVPAELVGDWEELTDDERAELGSMAGVIVSTDSAGFVYVTTYTDRDELDAEWEAIVAELDPESLLGHDPYDGRESD